MPRTKTKGSILPETILQASAQLFIEKGFDGTNMNHIAEALGVTRTAVYYYYKNKEAILVALTDNVTRVAAELAEEAAQHKDLSPVDALRTLVGRHVRLIIDHAAQFRIVERSEDCLPPKRRAAAAQYRRGVIANFTAVIERGIKTGVFRVEDAKVAAFAIIGMSNWTAWWFNPEGRKSRDEVAELLSNLAVHSLHPAPDSGSATDIGEALRMLKKEIGYLEKRVAQGAS